mmetsp:Transcript_57581/g.153863  ORF Transcript_57581/g.153863 Transcript_57581/m.153863 type:complete len:340 (+) Transcript_57581:1442-2461(+)
MPLTGLDGGSVALAARPGRRGLHRWRLQPGDDAHLSRGRHPSAAGVVPRSRQPGLLGGMLLAVALGRLRQRLDAVALWVRDIPPELLAGVGDGRLDPEHHHILVLHPQRDAEGVGEGLQLGGGQRAGGAPHAHDLLAARLRELVEKPHRHGDALLRPEEPHLLPAALDVDAAPALILHVRDGRARAVAEGAGPHQLGPHRRRQRLARATQVLQVTPHGPDGLLRTRNAQGAPRAVELQQGLAAGLDVAQAAPAAAVQRVEQLRIERDLHRAAGRLRSSAGPAAAHIHGVLVKVLGVDRRRVKVLGVDRRRHHLILTPLPRGGLSEVHSKAQLLKEPKNA